MWNLLDKIKGCIAPHAVQLLHGSDDVSGDPQMATCVAGFFTGATVAEKPSRSSRRRERLDGSFADALNTLRLAMRMPVFEKGCRGAGQI
jgi:hypothetical protein